MTRVHPQFLMNGFKKAVEKQDFGEFNKELTNGMNYWTNLFNTEVGALDPDEAAADHCRTGRTGEYLQENGTWRRKYCRYFPQEHEKHCVYDESTERQLMDGEIFTIRARRCKRCGRLLTSAEAVEKGYGCQCTAKAQAEEDEKKPIPGQMTFDDLFKNMEE